MNEVRLAYDVQYDRDRLVGLWGQFGDFEARQILLEEMTQDLVTHFAELGGEGGRILAFNWRYLIDENGILVEDSRARKPIREMFVGQTSSEAELWEKYLIEELESLPKGGMAFTLSSRADGQVFEGVYDMVYLFHKVDPQTILAFGLGVDLNQQERVSIVNREIVRGGNIWALLTQDATAEEIRSRAVIYHPETFASAYDAYVNILNYSRDEVEERFLQASNRLDEKRTWVAPLAVTLIDIIAHGEIETANYYLQRAQLEQLYRYDPRLVNDLRQSGEVGVMLPCGFVAFGFSLSDTVGDGLIWSGSTYKGEWHTGNCRTCGRANVDVGECDVCRHCQWEFDTGIRH